MASLKFRHYATERALIGSNTLQVALNAMDVGNIVFIDDTQTQYIITSKNNNVVTYSTYYGKAAITGVTGTGATRTLTFSDGSEITITINNVEHAITSESCSGNANSATTLQNTRKINGTNFNGSADITTSNWGISRNIGIVNSDGSGTAIPVSINGSNNINLKLPSTIKANLEGNASTANTAISAGSATSDSNGNNIVNTYARIDKVYSDSSDYRQFLGKNGSSTDWIRTTVNGIIPYISGDSSHGHCSLGTPSWYFSKAYIQNIYGYLYGNISGSSTSCSGNAVTATKLQTARKIWGQNFDGTGNVSGALTGVTDIEANGVIYSNKYSSSGNASVAAFVFNKGGDLFGIGPSSGGVSNVGFGTVTGIAGTWKRELMTIANNGNVGIGTISPTSKLHVAGTGYFTSDVSSASNIIAGGYIKGETVKISSGCTLQYDSAQKCVKFVF